MQQSNTGSRAYLISIVMVAVLGGLLFGYDTAVISGAEKGLQAFFRGAGDTIFPLVVSIVTQFAYRIAAIGPFLAVWPTPSGIWYLYVSSWFLMFALDWAYHKTGLWKKYAKAIKAGV